MYQPSVTITLRELITSGGLDACFSIRGEDDGQQLTNTHQGDKESQRLSNAVKISLLLAKEFARCDSDGGDGSHHLTSVQLGGINVELCILSAPSMNGFNEDKEQKENSNNPVSGGVFSNNWILSSVKLNPAIHSHDVPKANDSSAAKLQNLGRLIYSVFSQNKELPAFSPSSNGTSQNGYTSTSSKQKRGQETSLFSNLIESGDYPVSICRLLSDMIDTSIENGKADSPFQTFNEVIQDLEQMSLHPYIYLHDSALDGNFKLIFGQRYYGHKKEMSQLLAVSTDIEQSAKEDSGLKTSLQPPAEIVFVKGVAG